MFYGHNQSFNEHNTLTVQYFYFCFHDLGGRDDSKLLIPATVVLRYMFSPAEMRVMFSNNLGMFFFSVFKHVTIILLNYGRRMKI